MMFGSQKPIIGVIHLPPLPGYENNPGIDAIVEKALSDLRALESGPVDAVLVENENDKPHRVAATPLTTAAMTRVTRELVNAAQSCCVGVEILLNDPEASLAVALTAGASFIRHRLLRRSDGASRAWWRDAHRSRRPHGISEKNRR